MCRWLVALMVASAEAVECCVKRKAAEEEGGQKFADNQVVGCRAHIESWRIAVHTLNRTLQYFTHGSGKKNWPHKNNQSPPRAAASQRIESAATNAATLTTKDDGFVEIFGEQYRDWG
jgi:hypothetical protein